MERGNDVSRAILRWPDGGDWGHVAVPGETGLPRFAGFVRMADPLVLELLTVSTASRVDNDFWEVHFAAEANELLAV